MALCIQVQHLLAIQLCAAPNLHVRALANQAEALDFDCLIGNFKSNRVVVTQLNMLDFCEEILDITRDQEFTRAAQWSDQMQVASNRRMAGRAATKISC